MTVVFLADVHSALLEGWPQQWQEQEAWLKAKVEHDAAKRVCTTCHSCGA